jgi:hypothetical protein
MKLLSNSINYQDDQPQLEVESTSNTGVIASRRVWSRALRRYNALDRYLNRIESTRGASIELAWWRFLPLLRT